MAISSGARLGPYEILAPLGAGGMGEVYRARDLRLERNVAIKVLPERLADDPQALARFEHEAKAVAALSHPNILAIHDFGREGSVAYAVMELLEGETLRSRIRRGSMPVRKAAEIGAEIAGGLSAAHSKGVIHRDLKPENVFLTEDGRVKILDFGIAQTRAADAADPAEQSTVTQEGFALGTIGYMSPEQACARPVDSRTDIFSFGAMLYEMISGQRAFCGDSAAETASAILKEEPPPLADPALDRIVRRCLEKSPSQRFQSASDLAFALQSLSGTTGINAAHATGPLAAAAGPRPYPWLAAGCGFLLAIVFAALWQSARREADAPGWTAERLAGPEIAMTPRVSPDGRSLAFLAIVDGQSQVGVMNPDSGNWTILTHDRGQGIATTECWSPDGASIFFDRVIGLPRGVYRVPALGGEAQRVLEDAGAPEALPDGSLLVVRVNALKSAELHRFWPATGKLEPLGVAVSAGRPHIRILPGAKEAVFYGRPIVPSGSKTPLGRDAPAPQAGMKPQPGAGRSVGYYAVDLASKRVRRLAPEIRPNIGVASGPLISVTPAGSLLLGELTGDLTRLVEFPHGGKTPGRTFLHLANDLSSADADARGRVYVDQWERPAGLLRFGPSGGAPQQVVTAASAAWGIALSPDRYIFASVTAGRIELFLAKPGRDAAPFIQTTEETFGPLAMLGADEVAFELGSYRDPASWRLAVASISDGRVLRQFEKTKGTSISSLGASPGGHWLYYSDSDSAWSLDAASADAAPRKLAPGAQVAADPGGAYLVAEKLEADGLHLSRIAIPSGAAQPIPMTSPMRLVGIGTNAVSRDGRILLVVESADSWWDFPAMLDPRTGRIERINLAYSGDLNEVGWTPDGQILATGLRMQSSIWRYWREGASSAK